MAKIDNGNNSNTKKEKTIEELKSEYEVVKNEIRMILNGRTDTKDIKDEEKKALRQHYANASRIARELSKRCTNGDESERYKTESKKLADRSIQYGSVMKF